MSKKSKPKSAKTQIPRQNLIDKIQPYFAANKIPFERSGLNELSVKAGKLTHSVKIVFTEHHDSLLSIIASPDIPVPDGDRPSVEARLRNPHPLDTDSTTMEDGGWLVYRRDMKTAPQALTDEMVEDLYFTLMSRLDVVFHP